jgi:hypothetical protein
MSRSSQPCLPIRNKLAHIAVNAHMVCMMRALSVQVLLLRLRVRVAVCVGAWGCGGSMRSPLLHTPLDPALVLSVVPLDTAFLYVYLRKSAGYITMPLLCRGDSSSHAVQLGGSLCVGSPTSTPNAVMRLSAPGRPTNHQPASRTNRRTAQTFTPPRPPAAQWGGLRACHHLGSYEGLGSPITLSAPETDDNYRRLRPPSEKTSAQAPETEIGSDKT